MEHIRHLQLQRTKIAKDVGLSREKMGFIRRIIWSCRRFFGVYVLQCRMTIPFLPVININKRPKEVNRFIFDLFLLICLTHPNGLFLNLVNKKSIWMLMKNDFELSGGYYRSLSLVIANYRKHKEDTFLYL